jgi:mono/diheme cytochrome c family protein
MSDQEKTETVPPERASGGGIDRGRAWLTGIGLGALAVAALVIAFTIGTNYSDEPLPAAPAGKEVSEAPSSALPAQGRELFVSTCGGCHTLAEAETAGTTGPNLDDLAPDEALVKQAIAQGGTGSGVMPPGLLSGGDAEQVAEYVSAAAGGD